MNDVEDRPKEGAKPEVRDEDGHLKPAFVTAVETAVNSRDRDTLNALVGNFSFLDFATFWFKLS